MADRWQVLILGANVAWLAVFWPLVDADNGTGGAALAVLCPLPLLVGTLPRTLPPALRSACLWVAFPALVAAAVAFRPETQNQHALPLPLLVLLGLSLCAYGALAAHAFTTYPMTLSVTHRPLGEAVGLPPQAGSWRRRALIGLCFAGAWALCFVAPTWGKEGALTGTEDNTSTALSVFSAIVGAALGATTLAIFLSSALREKRPAPRPGRSLRVTRYLFLAVLGALTYFTIAN